MSLIDLAGSSSADEEGTICHSPDELQSDRSRPASEEELRGRLLRKKKLRNKRKIDNGIKYAAATTRGEGSIRASSSPSLSSARKAPPNPMRDQEKLEALRRARRWHEERKRGRFGDRLVGGASAAPVVVAAADSAGGNGGAPSASSRSSRDASLDGISEVPLVASSSSSGGTQAPRSRKIGRREAKERARKWAESLRSSGTNGQEEEGDGEGKGEGEGEVIDLSSPSADSSRSSPARSIWRGGHPSYSASSFGLPRGSAADGMGRSSRMETRREQPPYHVEISSNAAAFGGARSEPQRQEQWACPRCTLLNHRDRLKCDACLCDNPSRNNTDDRGGAPARRFYFDVDDDNRFVPESGRVSSDDHAAGSAVPAVAVAPVASGRAPNSHVGISRGSALISNYRDLRGALDAAEAAGSFRALGHGYRNTGTASGDPRRALGGMLAGGIHQQSFASSDGDGWGRPRNFNPPTLVSHGVSRNTAFLSHLLQAMTYADSGRGQRESLDDMSYERLLQLFGDGGENRGASSETISSLPVSTIVDPERELPEDKRQCCICLEDFCRGEGRTSLPCLHGYHTGCVNRWLSSNGSCPVCKTSVSGD
ncbi:hypothetical protein ACHAW5_004784 [Stephanodiscus triporus]|uniref:RING-type E3 ubiquitin transferase n=1 Tax=Stephanodiscus triporus TaxID=2934178 RepID=A0ABD3N5Z0_9STRA